MIGLAEGIRSRSQQSPNYIIYLDWYFLLSKGENGSLPFKRKNGQEKTYPCVRLTHIKTLSNNRVLAHEYASPAPRQEHTSDSSLVPSVETLCLLLECLCLRSGLRGSYERFPPVAGVNGTRCRRRCLFSKIASEREVFRWRGCVCRDGWVNVDESGCRVGWITGYIPVLSLFHFYSIPSLAPG